MQKILMRRAALFIMLMSIPAGLSAAQPELIPVYLVVRGYHTGIVIPVTESSSAIISVLSRTPDGSVEFGWGEEYYYQTPDTTASDAVKALCLPNRSVLRVEYFASDPEYAAVRNEKAVKFLLTATGFADMCRYIDRSFVREDFASVSESEEKNGRVVYFAAHGTYHLFNNCNMWAAEALSAAGIDIVLFGIIHSSQLMSRCRQKGIVVKE